MTDIVKESIVPVEKDEQEAARRCDKWLENGITSNPSIMFLLKTLVDSGCAPPDKFIRCMQCKQPQAGGFGMISEESISSTGKERIPDDGKVEQCRRTSQDFADLLKREREGMSSLVVKPEIFICQQYMESEKMTHKTVHHELIHAIDMCRTNMDPLHNCIHTACTEIRAENLSGECSFLKELPRMKRFAGHGADCVRRRAILSVRANPKCAPRTEEYVDAAMTRCFLDTYPYEKHPNQM